MRIEAIGYACKVRGSEIILDLEYWAAGKYPLSFTPQECIEEFCDSVGWEFLKIKSLAFTCKIPYDELLMDTIYDCAYGLAS